MKLAPGTVIGGRYRLRESCGSGAMAEVWAAEDSAAGDREVAIKVMRELVGDPDQVARFEREARAVGRIESPYVCRLFDVGRSEDGTPFLVLERLVGETLAERITRQGVMPLSDVEPILAHVWTGLVAAHAAGVVHRDLKPSNVFLSASAGGPIECKLLDFGVSKIIQSDPTGWEPVLTTEHTTLGSMAFMAPEQIGGSSAVDARADLYAAGVVGYRALTGRLPFNGPSLQALMILKVDHEPPSLSEVTGRSWPASLDGFFRVALSREPSTRFQSADQALAAWGAACAAARTTAMPSRLDLIEGAVDDAEPPTETMPGRRSVRGRR